jgi:hypothetical protein
VSRFNAHAHAHAHAHEKEASGELNLAPAKQQRKSDRQQTQAGPGEVRAPAGSCLSWLLRRDSTRTLDANAPSSDHREIHSGGTYRIILNYLFILNKLNH